MSRRPLALGSLVGGSLLALVASGQLATAWTSTWVSEDFTRSLALVALVGSVLLLVLRVRGRRVVGLLLAVLGVGMFLAGALLSEPPTPWRVGYSIGSTLVVFGGFLTMITSSRWLVPAGRFERDDERSPSVSESDDPAELWKAMDAGVDPTADPDVRKSDAGDTMRSANQSQQSSRRK